MKETRKSTKNNGIDNKSKLEEKTETIDPMILGEILEKIPRALHPFELFSDEYKHRVTLDIIGLVDKDDLQMSLRLVNAYMDGIIRRDEKNRSTDPF